MIPVQLEYTQPAGCPTQAEFVTKVEGRGGDFAHPGEASTVRKMVVTLRKEGAEHTGALQLRFADAESEPRVVRGSSCDEVAEALAVVAAIALRGAEDAPKRAGTEEPAVAPPAPAPTPVEKTPEPAIATEPARVERKQTRLQSVGSWGHGSIPVTSGELQVERSLALTASGGVVMGAIPHVVLPRFDLDVSRASYISTPQGASYLIGGIFGVRWSYLGNAKHEDGSYSTKLSGFKAGLNACASLSYDTEGFVALLCSGFAVGYMQLDTRDASSGYSKTQNVGIGTASLELQSRYNLSRRLHIGLNIGSELWLSRLKAERADGSELFRSSLFNANAQLGLGVHF